MRPVEGPSALGMLCVSGGRVAWDAVRSVLCQHSIAAIIAGQ
jgi:hypothetical protein